MKDELVKYTTHLPKNYVLRLKREALDNELHDYEIVIDALDVYFKLPLLLKPILLDKLPLI